MSELSGARAEGLDETVERSALRQFRRDVATPSPEVLARGREYVVQVTREAPMRAGAMPPRRGAAGRRLRGRWRGTRRWWAPVGVTVAVVAVVLGAFALLAPGGGAPALQVGGPGSSDTRTDSRDNPGAASTPEHAAAVAVLEELASVAEADNDPPGGGLTVGPGQFLYVRSVGAQWTPPYTHEMWLDVNGSIPLMIRRTDGTQSFTAPDPTSPKDTHESEVAQQQADIGAQGPSLLRPTPAYLASLPTDPQQLLTLLRDKFGPVAGDWSVDHGVVDQTRQLLYQNEPLLTPAVRGALYRALALVPGVGSAGEVTYQGKSYMSIWFTERDVHETELLLDSETGRVVGEGPVDRAVLWHYAVVDELGIVS